MKKIFTTIMLMLFLAIMAFAKGLTATVVLSVEPQMTCQNCENKIKTNIRFEKGVSAIATDIASQTIKITYDPAKTNPEKLVGAFKKIGYTATVAMSAEKNSTDDNRK